MEPQAHVHVNSKKKMAPQARAVRACARMDLSMTGAIIFRTVSELIPLEEIDYRSFSAEICKY